MRNLYFRSVDNAVFDLPSGSIWFSVLPMVGATFNMTEAGEFGETVTGIDVPYSTPESATIGVPPCGSNPYFPIRIQAVGKVLISYMQ